MNLVKASQIVPMRAARPIITNAQSGLNILCTEAEISQGKGMDVIAEDNNASIFVSVDGGISWLHWDESSKIMLPAGSETTILLKAVVVGVEDSRVRRYRFIVKEQSSKPIIDVNKGIVTITAVSGSRIYYTIDGSDPDSTKERYGSPFSADPGTVIKAVAYEDGKGPSPISTMQMEGVEMQGVVPLPESVVRCWSLRRNLADYSTGRAVAYTPMAMPVFLPGVDLSFGQDGNIANVPDEESALYSLYNQAGNQESTLTIDGSLAEFSPLMHNGVERLIGASFSPKTYNLALSGTDSALDMALSRSGIGYTISMWVNLIEPAEPSGTILYYATAAAGIIAIIIVRTGSTIAIDFGNNDPLYAGDLSAGWANIVLTVKGESVEKNAVLFYINSVNRMVANKPGLVSLEKDEPLKIGSGGRHMMINDIVVYNCALTEPQVQQLYNAQAEYYGLAVK